jgi:hypothetical protein
MIRRLCLALLLVAGQSAQANDYADLFHEAAEAIEWDIEDNWAFTETRLGDDKVWVSRFDPRRPKKTRWVLLSVNGREPTADELREFRDEKANYRIAENSDQADIVAVDSLQLLDENASSWDFRFVPDEDHAEFVDNVDGTARIRKDGPWIEFIDLRNTADISPGFGSKFRTFVVRLEFGPAVPDGPIVPKRIEVQVSGRVMFLVGFSETELISYSDFELAGDRN